MVTSVEVGTLPEAGRAVKGRGFNAASAVTLSGLLASLTACALAIRAQPLLAWVAFMVAGLADMLDGPIARALPLSDYERRLGANLDNLVDMASFAATPFVLGYCAGLNGAWGFALLALYATAVCWRLASFPLIGVSVSRAGARVYQGLPVTYSAVVLPLLAALGLALPQWNLVLLAAGFALMIPLMLSRWPFPRPRRWGMLALIVLALVLGGVFVSAAKAQRGLPQVGASR